MECKVIMRDDDSFVFGELEIGDYFIDVAGGEVLQKIQADGNCLRVSDRSKYTYDEFAKVRRVTLVTAVFRG